MELVVLGVNLTLSPLLCDLGEVTSPLWASDPQLPGVLFPPFCSRGGHGVPFVSSDAQEQERRRAAWVPPSIKLPLSEDTVSRSGAHAREAGSEGGQHGCLGRGV